jgi:Toprim domain
MEAIMAGAAADLARRLAGAAEAVCRHYLSNGGREGNYWLVGDATNTPGRSLYVRLTGPNSGKGAMGKWTDAATGEHGDLLDLIAANRGLFTLRETLDEARDFLSVPREIAIASPAPVGSREAARRLFTMAQPIKQTLAEDYLRDRGLTNLGGCDALRFHPRCYYRPGRYDAPGVGRAWPALLAKVTDNTGTLTGTHRTWLDPSTASKAPVATPRRAMGDLLGHGVRIGGNADVMMTGEGMETMLSLRQPMPALPIIAALSAPHLAALAFPPAVRRLYIARDRDATGTAACLTLFDRAAAAGIEAVTLEPAGNDFNDDLRQRGGEWLQSALLAQLNPSDVERFFS